MKKIKDMIKRTIKIEASILLLAGLMITISCNDSEFAEGNPSDPSVATSFNTVDEAEKAAYGMYAALQANDLWAREFWWIPDMLSDETQTAGPQLEAFRAAILNYNIDPANPLLTTVWRGLYRVIARANLIINTLPEKEDLPQEVVDRLVAEAKFLRGWCYFQLGTYWGDVPLTLAPVENTEGIPMAGSEDAVFEVVIEDLRAATALPDVSEYRGTENLGRATSGAAYGMLGRVYLYRGNYEAARDALQEVISSGNYSLVDDYVDNHQEENENNSESLFEIQFSLYPSGNQGWSQEGNGGKIEQLRTHEYSPHVWHNTLPSESLKAEFEEGDPRYAASFLTYGDTYGAQDTSVFDAGDVAQGITEIPVHWKKYGYEYKIDKPEPWSGINMRVLRYADVLLMMAEIENELNGPTATALDYLNQVRARVDMPAYPTAEYPVGSQDEMLAAIMHERRVELNSEQVRARDMKRWFREGKMGKPHPNYEDKHQYLPIAFDEIDNNAAIDESDQKEGY